MITMTEITERDIERPEPLARVRIAASWSVCAAPACYDLIREGSRIEHVQGAGWCHLGCARTIRRAPMRKAWQDTGRWPA
jgi:hypothetical protein